MPHVVIGTATAIVCASARCLPRTALEQARNASTEFPVATGVWWLEALSEAPWHAWVVVPERRSELL